jgi:hypothetical protein
MTRPAIAAIAAGLDRAKTARTDAFTCFWTHTLRVLAAR